MSSSILPSENAETFESPEGSVLVWFPARGMAAARCIGHVTGEVTRRGYELVGAQPSTPHEGFLDVRALTGFDWEARGRALKWNLTHLSPKMQLHILVESAPLRLAFRVFELALRDHVEIHTDPASFASAYQLAVKRLTRAGAAAEASRS